jgi:ubiquitin-protein ligase
MSSTPQRALNQFKYVLNEINKLKNDPNIARTTQFIIDDEKIDNITIIITPIDGLYKNMSFTFRLNIPPLYPSWGHPIIPKCLTNIYHPNISENGVCLYYDNIIDDDVALRESLEQLIVGINYLFIHPGNMIKPQTNDILVKNIEEMKNVKYINSNKLAYESKILYSNEFNDSLTKINNWTEYFPQSIIKYKHNGYRNYAVSMSGSKIYSIEKLDTVLSHIIRDPRYHFISNDISNTLNTSKTLNMNTIMLSKVGKIIYPSEINKIVTSNIYNSHHANINFHNPFSSWSLYDKNDTNDTNDTKKKTIMMTNIKITSNYLFSFCVDNKLITFSEEIDSLYVMKIDYLPSFASNNLHVCEDVTITKPLKFHVEMCTITINETMKDLFKNVVFKLNSQNTNDQFIIYDNGMTLRNLTNQEKEYIDCKKEQTDLIEKYIAKNSNQAGFDISKMNSIH